MSSTADGGGDDTAGGSPAGKTPRRGIEDMSKDELVESLSFLTINTMFPESCDGEIVASNWFNLADKAVALLQKIIQINGGLQEQCMKHIGLEHAAIKCTVDHLHDMRLRMEPLDSSDSDDELAKDLAVNSDSDDELAKDLAVNSNSEDEPAKDLEVSKEDVMDVDRTTAIADGHSSNAGMAKDFR